MSILINEATKVMVQGITGRDGSFHARTMAEDGTRVVGGVTPGKGGQSMEGIPVFDRVSDCRSQTGADASAIFVPARYAAAAIREAVEAGISLVACITEGVPIKDMREIYHMVKGSGTTLIGPNCPGLISPGKCKIGIMPYRIHKPGRIGVISRSGTLTYEVVNSLTLGGLGQSTCVGIGGDPVIGTGFIDLLERFEEDPDTDGAVIIGEIGGQDEERAADYIKSRMTKPVAAFISGRAAPKGKRMGHAGAIISGNTGTAEAKVAALTKAGVPVADKPDQIPGLLKERL